MDTLLTQMKAFFKTKKPPNRLVLVHIIIPINAIFGQNFIFKQKTQTCCSRPSVMLKIVLRGKKGVDYFLDDRKQQQTSEMWIRT